METLTPPFEIRETLTPVLPARPNAGMVEVPRLHLGLGEQFGRHCLPNLRIDGVEEAEAASFAGIYPLQPRVYQQLGGNLIHAG